MIKLFAWEPKMKEKLDETREEELGWIRRAKITGLVNRNLKWVCACAARLAVASRFAQPHYPPSDDDRHLRNLHRRHAP